MDVRFARPFYRKDIRIVQHRSLARYGWIGAGRVFRFCHRG